MTDITPEQGFEDLKEVLARLADQHGRALEDHLNVPEEDQSDIALQQHRARSSIYGGLWTALELIEEGHDPFGRTEDGDPVGFTLYDEDGNEKGWWPEPNQPKQMKNAVESDDG